jgi:tRNA nucleotidyltransferase (CCA-adding enzyme)
LGFHIEPRTMELLEQALPLMDRVSGERIRSELDAIFVEPEVIAIMEGLEERGLLKAIHPSFGWGSWLADRFTEAIPFKPPSEWGLTAPVDRHFRLYSLCLSPLLKVKAQELCNRLRFPLAVERDLLSANRLSHLLARLKEPCPPSQYVEWMEDIQERALVASWMTLEDGSIGRNAIVQYLVCWRKVSATVDGETLQQMNLPPSPAYKEILWRLRAAWLDGQVVNDEEERQLMERLVEEARGNG